MDLPKKYKVIRRAKHMLSLHNGGTNISTSLTRHNLEGISVRRTSFVESFSPNQRRTFDRIRKSTPDSKFSTPTPDHYSGRFKLSTSTPDHDSGCFKSFDSDSGLRLRVVKIFDSDSTALVYTAQFGMPVPYAKEVKSSLAKVRGVARP